MPVDPWATTTAQEFRPQEPDMFRRLWGIIAAQKREMFDLRASVLANVSDIVADLQAKQAALAAQDIVIGGLIADLTTAQATLAAQAAYLSSLVTKDATAAGFNTGTLTADSTIRYVGTPGTLSIACPTGKLRIIASCPEASIDTGTGAGGVIAYLSFAISGQVAMGAYTSRLYSAGTRIGATLTRVKTLTVPPGTYTVSVQAGYWCSGFTAASIDFADMDLSAEVVNAS